MYSINRITTLQYLGSKNRILESICNPIIEDSNINKVVDLFAGTGSVGYALSPFKQIISNDLEYYAYVQNEAILNGCLLEQSELDALLFNINIKLQVSEGFLQEAITAEKDFLSLPLEAFEKYAAFSDNTPSVFSKDTEITALKQLEKLVKMVTPGKKVQDVPFPCLFTSYFSNAYFGIRQCCQIDAIVAAILELTDTRQRNVLLTTLMSALSPTASTTTHFAQFLKVKSKNTFRNIIAKRSADIVTLFKDAINRFSNAGLLQRITKEHVCYNDDFEVCLKRVNIDKNTLVYADPPYFKEHYSRYYHVLNTLCLYDYPQLAINLQRKEYSIGRYRADRRASNFGKRAKAISAFESLINICADKQANLMISYSENSLVKIYELLQLAKTRYKVRVERVNLRHSSQGRATETNQTVKEYIFFCTLPDNIELAVESFANKIRGIKPIVDNPGGFLHNYMARKPYNVVSALIQAFTVEGNVVYDPMFGSGTTLIEASKLKRKAIGTDINPIAVELCSVSLKKWDLLKINKLIDDFVSDVSEVCYDIYTGEIDGEKIVIERCHFDQGDSGLVPTEFWYKVVSKSRLSGRRRSSPSQEFCQTYHSFRGIELHHLQDHALIPNSRIAIKDGATVFSYFCNRNIVALDRIMSILDNYRDHYGYEVLKLLTSSSINLIKLSDKKASSQMPYWLPKKNATSRNAVFIINKKAKAVKDGLAFLKNTCKFLLDDGNVRIYNVPAQDIGLNELSDNSVDLVLTDPPYTDQVPYLEYNQLWYLLLDLHNKVDLESELVVSDAPSRKKDYEDFNVVFEAIIKRTVRSLKKDGMFIMFYHTFDLKSWSNILSMMQMNGLRYIHQVPTPAPRKSFKTIMSPKSTLDGNYLLFFVKGDVPAERQVVQDVNEAVEMASECADRIIRSREHVTTQDLYDQGMLEEAFEHGYLATLSNSYKTFADVIKDRFKYKDGYWEVIE